ncbi:hypothetical protein S7335_14 [Synechococcus sp. PCC 7335]|nr:hypothetical protein S7335_14 [Synechococcus sp. PCC 7335]
MLTGLKGSLNLIAKGSRRTLYLSTKLIETDLVAVSSPNPDSSFFS